jgi:hypothetical protein
LLTILFYLHTINSMRRFSGFILFLAGCALIAARWVPAAMLPIPAAGWWLPLGIVAVVMGIVLLRPRNRRTTTFGDAPLINILRERGFTIAPEGDGWLANGTWKSITMVVRKSSGYQAARFARPWTIAVGLPGTPIEPWPLLPEEGLIVERHENGFTVTCTDLSRVERMHRLGERLDQLIKLRQ